jgi:hypothetical protein
VKHKPEEYPEAQPETQRPFRIWDSEEKHDVQYRYYITERRALDTALLLVRWEKVGRTLEVYDVRTGRWLGTYKRGVNSIQFTGIKGAE